MIGSLERSLRLLGIVALTCAAGCAGVTTQLSATWQDPTFHDPPFRKLAVLALFESEAESRNFEQIAVDLLGRRGIDAVQGHTIIDRNGDYDQDEMRARLLEAATDGVLVFRQIAVDEREVYVSPGPYLHSIPPSIIWGDPYYWYYYPHWNYYWHWRATREVIRAPGYWATVRYIIVETSLYDGESNKLIWTAKSETLDPERASDLAESIAGKVTRELVAARLVAPTDDAERLAQSRTSKPRAR